MHVADLALTPHGENAIKALLFQYGGTQGDKTCEKGVFQIADQQADDVAAAGAKLLCGTIGLISELLCDTQDSLSGIFGDTRPATGAVQNDRNRSMMHLRLSSYLANRSLHV
jgi:hypothetical protein